MTESASTLQEVALLLLCSVAYDTFISRRGTIETWWWGVYVAAAPLLFGDFTIHPVLGLFCTRFVIEALTMARGHWAIAVASGGAGDLRVRGLPVIPD